jgi:hypothetical protein
VTQRNMVAPRLVPIQFLPTHKAFSKHMNHVTPMQEKRSISEAIDIEVQIWGTAAQKPAPVRGGYQRQEGTILAFRG